MGFLPLPCTLSQSAPRNGAHGHRAHVQPQARGTLPSPREPRGPPRPSFMSPSPAATPYWPGSVAHSRAPPLASSLPPWPTPVAGVMAVMVAQVQALDLVPEGLLFTPQPEDFTPSLWGLRGGERGSDRPGGEGGAEPEREGPGRAEGGANAGRRGQLWWAGLEGPDWPSEPVQGGRRWSSPARGWSTPRPREGGRHTAGSREAGRDRGQGLGPLGQRVRVWR